MRRIFQTLILLLLVSAVANLAQASVSQAQRRSGGASVRFVARQIRESNRRFRYTIKARYPQAVGAQRDAQLAKMNQELRRLMVKEVSEFKGYFTEPSERLGPTGSSYDSSYVVTMATGDLVSIIFYVSTYGEGAAHPNHVTIAFNYDLKAGKALRLGDLFKPNSNYMRVISDYSIAALKKELGPDPDSDWIQSGAGPEEKNYQSWNVTPKGLTITFDPYQVASYAEGQHEVVIPLRVLKDLIDPSGPLGKMRN